MVGLELKKDRLKDKWHLLPMAPIRWIVKVLMFGAYKYSPDGWKHGDYKDARQRYYDAAYRHIVIEWWEGGNFFDEETGLPHLAHGACCVIFLLWYDMRYQSELFHIEKTYDWQEPGYWEAKEKKVSQDNGTLGPWATIKVDK